MTRFISEPISAEESETPHHTTTGGQASNQDSNSKPDRRQQSSGQVTARDHRTPTGKSEIGSRQITATTLAETFDVGPSHTHRSEIFVGCRF